MEERRRVDLRNVEIVDDVTLPPRVEEREVEEELYQDDVKKIPIMHTHIKEQFEEVDVPVKKTRYVTDPKIEVLKRKIKIEKPVKKQIIKEVPQLHVVDKITEKYEDIVKEKLVEKPMYIIQERIIPVPKRQVEEITVKIPKDKFEAVVNTQVEQMELQRSQRAEEMEREGRTSDIGKVRPSKVEGTGPKYKHVPKGVEVPVLYYKPKAVERLIDRNVPVPVELHVVQEIQCPTLIPSWSEQAVSVRVGRVIEKPVPADALNNKSLLKMYLAQTKDIDEFALKRMKGQVKAPGPDNPKLYPMTDLEAQAANINLHPEKLKTLMSGEVEAMEYTNASLDQGGLFAQKISLGKDMTASQVMSKMQGQI